jgi:hypothetical protein
MIEDLALTEHISHFFTCLLNLTMTFPLFPFHSSVEKNFTPWTCSFYENRVHPIPQRDQKNKDATCLG